MGARNEGRRARGTGTVKRRPTGKWWWAPPRREGDSKPSETGPYDFRHQAERALDAWLREHGATEREATDGNIDGTRQGP